MPDQTPRTENLDPEPTRVMPIVVGAHLRAEIHDRPLGRRLRREIRRWSRRTLEATGDPEPGAARLQPVVLTDLWFLNAGALMAQPAIAIGHPAVNAASAYYASRLPAALVVEGSLQIQLDPELGDLHACIWGVGETATAAAVDLFVTRYLHRFLRAAHDLPPPPEGTTR